VAEDHRRDLPELGFALDVVAGQVALVEDLVQAGAQAHGQDGEDERGHKPVIRLEMRDGQVGQIVIGLPALGDLSLNALITKMYGKKTEEGQFEYMATASTALPYRSTEFIMQVAQLNADTVRKLQRTLGVYTPNTSIHTYNR